MSAIGIGHAERPAIEASASPPSYPAGVVPTFGGMFLTGSDYSALSSTTRNKFAEIIVGNANPDLATAAGDPAPRKLIYTLPMTAGSGSNDIKGVSQNQAAAVGALALDGGGSPIFNASAAGYLPKMDNTAFQDLFCNHMLAVLQANPAMDGLYMDNVDWDYLNLYAASPYYTDVNDWHTKSKAFYDRVNQFFQSRGYLIEGNARGVEHGGSVASNHGDITNQWWNYLVYSGAFRTGRSMFDILAQEFFMESFRFGSGQYTMIEDAVEPWSGWESTIDTAHGLGADVSMAETPRNNTAGDNMIAREARASLLLKWNGSYESVQWRNTTGLPGDSASFLYDVGTPTGAMTQPQTNVYRRAFTNGIVIVNASAGSITQDGHTVASGDAYIGA